MSRLGTARPREAIVLSAGQGKRLLPLTADRPKCSLEVGGQWVIHWQIDALLEAGIERVCPVLGYGAERVESSLAARYGRERVQPLFNPFFSVADNLASCWMAREAMQADFLLLNGDTLFEAGVLERLLDSPPAPVTLAVDHKPSYDDDDMKVQLDGRRLVRVGKTLPAAAVNAESIGMMVFRGHGPQLFRDALEEAMRAPSGLRRWYLSVIDALADDDVVQVCSIDGLRWAELDFPADLDDVEAVVTAGASARSLGQGS